MAQRISKKRIWDLADAIGYCTSITLGSILLFKRNQPEIVIEYCTHSNKEAYNWLMDKVHEIIQQHANA